MYLLIGKDNINLYYIKRIYELHWVCPRQHKKSTNRESDIRHVRSSARVIWASHSTGPIMFGIEKPVALWSPLSPFHEEPTLIYQNGSSISFLFLFSVYYVTRIFMAMEACRRKTCRRRLNLRLRAREPRRKNQGPQRQQLEPRAPISLRKT